MSIPVLKHIASTYCAKKYCVIICFVHNCVYHVMVFGMFQITMANDPSIQKANIRLNCQIITLDIIALWFLFFLPIFLVFIFNWSCQTWWILQLNVTKLFNVVDHLGHKDPSTKHTIFCLPKLSKLYFIVLALLLLSFDQDYLM